MDLFLAIAIIPLLGLTFAALKFSGEDIGSADRLQRPWIFVGRATTVLAILGCLGLFWIARGTLNEFCVAMQIVGFVTLMAPSTVFRRAPRSVHIGLSVCGFGLYLAGLVLKAFDEGGWNGLARGTGGALLLIGAASAVGVAIRLFYKRRERNDAGLTSMKDSTTS